MAKDEKQHAPKPEPKPEAMQQSGCVVCGMYTGALTAVTDHARAHEECSASRPDVIRKVKARA
jgi:hypothetical protein